MRAPFQIQVIPTAAEQIREALAWSRENADAAIFLRALEQAFERLSQHPWIGATSRNIRLPGSGACSCAFDTISTTGWRKSINAWRSWRCGIRSAAHRLRQREKGLSGNENDMDVVLDVVAPDVVEWMASAAGPAVVKFARLATVDEPS